MLRLPEESDALRAALAAAEARADVAEAELAVARAKASDDQAQIAHLKRKVANLQLQLHGPHADRPGPDVTPRGWAGPSFLAMLLFEKFAGLHYPGSELPGG